jgi:hypothetical protein
MGVGRFFALLGGVILCLVTLLAILDAIGEGQGWESLMRLALIGFLGEMTWLCFAGLPRGDERWQRILRSQSAGFFAIIAFYWLWVLAAVGGGRPGPAPYETAKYQALVEAIWDKERELEQTEAGREQLANAWVKMGVMGEFPPTRDLMAFARVVRDKGGTFVLSEYVGPEEADRFLKAKLPFSTRFGWGADVLGNVSVTMVVLTLVSLFLLWRVRRVPGSSLARDG